MRRPAPARILLVAAAALLAVVVAWDRLTLARATRELTAGLAAFGTAARNPAVTRDIATETDALRAGVKAARLLLAEELDRRWMGELSPADRAEALAQGESKLEMARTLASEHLKHRPHSWQALMILGGSRYLLANRRNEPGRWTHRAGWEEPLRSAIARAPHQPEPKRVLAAAYLNEWSIMGVEERIAGSELIRAAFVDLETLDQLLPAWLLKSSSFEEALSIVPDDPRAWRQLDHYYRQREDWQRLARVLVQLDRSLPAHLEGLIEQAEAMIAGGREPSGRLTLLGAIREMPRRAEYVDLFAEAIRLLPAGPVSERNAAGLREWADWTGEHCLLSECPFPAKVLERLTGLARGKTPAELASDKLLRGDLEGALAIEERSMPVVNRDAWIGYLFLKSNTLASRGSTRQAVTVLADLPRGARDQPLAARLARNLAPTGAAESLIDTGWEGAHGRYRRELLGFDPWRRLEIGFERVDAGGGVAELRINHRFAGFHAIEPGAVLRVDVEPASEYLLLELVREAGANYFPSSSF